MALLLSACGGCRKTDAERAAEERAKVEARIRDSYGLFPYRALKLTFRAKGEPGAPEEVERMWSLLLATQALPAKPATVEETRAAAAAYLALARGVYEAKQAMEKRDEDEFPLLWSKYAKGPPPFDGYDAGQEHLLAGALWLAIDVADRGGRLPATEVELYEFSRAAPKPSWPAPLRVAVRAGRGLSFCESGYHYAAEEECTAYLAEVEALPPDAVALWASAQRTPEQGRELLRSIGHFLRAWNRMELKREDAAAEDIEAGLASLQKLGIENELTWWGWAYLHYRRGKYEEAAGDLEKLARSPYVSEPERREILEAAEGLRRSKDDLAVLARAKGLLLIGRALLARAGGLDRVVAAVLGEEAARRMRERIEWIDRVRANVGQLDPKAVAREAGGVLDKAREAGSRELESLKEKLGGAGRDGEAAAEPGVP